MMVQHLRHAPVSYADGGGGGMNRPPGRRLVTNMSVEFGQICIVYPACAAHSHGPRKPWSQAFLGPCADFSPPNHPNDALVPQNILKAFKSCCGLTWATVASLMLWRMCAHCWRLSRLREVSWWCKERLLGQYRCFGVNLGALLP